MTLVLAKSICLRERLVTGGSNKTSRGQDRPWLQKRPLKGRQLNAFTFCLVVRALDFPW